MARVSASSPPPSEDEGVARLQAQHPQAPGRQFHQPQADILLRGGGAAAALAREFQHGAGGGQIQDAGIDQRVIDDMIGLAYSMQRQQGHQAGIAGTGADQPDAAGGEIRQSDARQGIGAGMRAGIGIGRGTGG